jgi:hypothetical protein
MGAIQSAPLPLDRPEDGKCDCLWGRNECPNRAAFAQLTAQARAAGLT